MAITTVIGIDPGLVHTGVVRLEIDTGARTLSIMALPVVNSGGPDAHTIEVLKAAYQTTGGRAVTMIFIEAYRPRGNNYGTDAPMRELMASLTSGLPSPKKVIDNTGSRRVIKPALLKLLGLNEFPTTHHQDLEAAARILVYGMLKDPDLNELIADVVVARHDPRPYVVVYP